MAEFGFEVEPDGHGGVGYFVPKGIDSGPIDAAADECLARLPEFVPPTAEELGELYDLYLDAQSCIEGEGYEIAEPAPSRERFIEESLSGDFVWSPYYGLPDPSHPLFIGTDEYNELLETCPDPVWQI